VTKLLQRLRDELDTTSDCRPQIAAGRSVHAVEGGNLERRWSHRCDTRMDLLNPLSRVHAAARYPVSSLPDARCAGARRL
jgi:hypothetical protein